MKRLSILIVLAFALDTARAADLLAVYQRALENDPELREAEANRLAALEAKPQAIAALLPQLSGTGTANRERDSGPTNETQVVTTGPTSAALGTPGATGTVTGTTTLEYPFDGNTTTTTYQYGVTLKMSLFSWQNWVALKRADAQLAQAEADYQAARQDLIARVSQRYFDVLAAQDDLDAQEGALISVNRQLEQAEARYQAGLIAITDVEEARAAHDSSTAAVIEAKRQLASSFDFLREITGDTVDSLARPVEPLQLENPDPLSADQWVNMALQQNLTLVSSRLAADIARENISAAESGHFPSLDLVGSRSKNKVNADSIYSNGTPYGSETIDQQDRTIGLQLTIPIYTGGLVSSQVRQAVYLHRAAKERLERVARQTEREARDAYLGVLSGISHVQALRRALESNLTALKATESGYDAGTRTAVDVLESRRLWIQAETNYSRSRYDYFMNVLKLQQSAGTLSEQSLGHVNQWLKEGAQPEKSSHY